MSKNHDELFEKILDGDFSESEATTPEAKSIVRLRQDLAALREEVPVCTLNFDGVKTELARQSAPKRRFAWGWAITPLAAAALGFLMLRNPQTMPELSKVETDTTPIMRSEPVPDGSVEAATGIAMKSAPDTSGGDSEKIAPREKVFATVPSTRTKQAPSRRSTPKTAATKTSTPKIATPAPALDVVPEVMAAISSADTSPREAGSVVVEPTVIILRDQDAHGTPMASEVEARSDVVVDG